MAENKTAQQDQNAADASPVVKAVRAKGFWLILQTLLLFWGAGTWHWQRGWLLVGVLLVMLVVDVAVLAKVNPEFLRGRFQRHSGTKGFDKVFILLFIPAMLAIFYVAGADAGRGSAPLGVRTILPGAVLYFLGAALVLWAMAENRYLEATVRIQEDRGHQVVTTGPYRFVRHPMYAGNFVMMAGWPLIAGSTWAFVPYAVVVLLFVIRTALEDRTLQEELPGYKDFTRQTRYRLLPGIW